MSFKRSIDEIKIKAEELRNSVFKGAEMLTVMWEIISARMEVYIRISRHGHVIFQGLQTAHAAVL